MHQKQDALSRCHYAIVSRVCVHVGSLFIDRRSLTRGFRTFVTRVRATTAGGIRHWYTCIGELVHPIRVRHVPPEHRRCELARNLEDWHFERVLLLVEMKPQQAGCTMLQVGLGDGAEHGFTPGVNAGCRGNA